MVADCRIRQQLTQSRLQTAPMSSVRDRPGTDYRVRGASGSSRFQYRPLEGCDVNSEPSPDFVLSHHNIRIGTTSSGLPSGSDIAGDSG